MGNVEADAPTAGTERALFASVGTDEVSGEGFLRRALARGLDFLVFNVIQLVVLVLMTIVVLLYAALAGVPEGAITERLETLGGPISTLLSVLAALAYFTAFEALYGATPAKRLLGLVVVSEDLGPCTAGAALKRNVLFWLETLAFGVPAFLAIRGSPRAQRHGDRWAGTIVPRRSAVPPDLLRPASRFLQAGLLAVLASMASVGLMILVRL
jgi:uncharacterized RDD family membrane protein YckC